MAVQFIHEKRRIRAHSKSRKGCQACKERKIKCCQSQPQCNNCFRRGYTCLYPVPRQQQQLQQNESSQLVPSLAEHGLNLTDLRLFHHFLTYAHPHLPLGRGTAWITDIPCRANEHPHLMHAILALSASHLGMFDTSIAPSLALSHRQKALTWLSGTLSTLHDTTETDLEVTAYVSMALMFQAGFMYNAFYEFMKILRGTGALSLAKLRMQKYLGPLPHTSTYDEVNDLFVDVTIDERIPQAAAQSLLNVEHLIPAQGPLRELYQMEIDIANSLQSSSWEGYVGTWNMFTTVTLQPPEIAAQVLSAEDPIAKILQAHMLCLSIILTPLRVYEFAVQAQWHPMEAMISWVDGICSSIDDNYSMYVRWPAQLYTAVNNFGKSNRVSASNLASLLLDQPELFLVPG